MDVGLHEIGGIEESGMQRDIFRDLKIIGNIEFLKLPE